MNLKMEILAIVNSLKKDKICLYMNTYDVLPKPLSKEEEKECIDRMKDDAYYREKLIRHNLRLVVYIARKFDTNINTLEDLISIGTIGLIKAVNTYCRDKNIKLATYASKCIENEILMHLRKVNKLKTEVSLDEPLNTDRDGNELVLGDVIKSDDKPVGADLERQTELTLLRGAVCNLKEEEKQILYMRYGVGGYRRRTQKEVAESMQISQSYISRLEKKIVKNLKKEMLKMTNGV